jgi:manganese transport protein
VRDLYDLRPEDVEQPPSRLGQTLRRIGPGMILAASIVGSGELIATTTLGAEAGYTALWIVVGSCFLKPAIQAAIGRYSVLTGRTGLDGFNRVPGPRFRVNWVVWAWAAMVAMSLFQVGAMYGGVAMVLNTLMPGVPVNVWVILLLGLTLWLLLGGGYERIEKIATIKVGLFTMVTFLAALLLMRRSDLFHPAQVLREGFAFDMPKGGGLITAIAVFGITGVGASELFMYPYWCIEKGYARFTGRNDGSQGWSNRARGWLRVMHFDITASMVIYTIATVAFYLLGAGILHPQGIVPGASDMIKVLSKLYTETLGQWALALFYLGAVVTLYGTIFAATAAHSRVFADFCRLLGAFDATDYPARLRYRRWFVVGLASVPALLFLFFQSPVNMVRAGGVAQAIMLPVIAVGTLYMFYKETPWRPLPSRWLVWGLWTAGSATITVALISFWLTALQ